MAAVEKSTYSQRNTTKATALKWGFKWLEIVEEEKRNGQVFVKTMRCRLCAKHEPSISKKQNFNKAWCFGTDNVKKVTRLNQNVATSGPIQNVLFNFFCC